MAKVGQDSGKEQRKVKRVERVGVKSAFSSAKETRTNEGGRGSGIRSKGLRGHGGPKRGCCRCRKRDGSHFSRRGHPFPGHDHREIQTKMANSGKKSRGLGRYEGRERYRAKEENGERRKSSAERQRGRRGRRKKDDRRVTARTVALSSIRVFLFCLFRAASSSSSSSSFVLAAATLSKCYSM